MPTKVVEWVALALSAVIVVVLAGAYLIPRHPVVTRSIDIAAPPATVFALVGDLRRFNDWSPWFERDREAAFTFTGPIDGVGQTFRWDSAVPEVGAGTMVVARSEPETEVEIALDAQGQRPALTWFTLEPKGATTTVTWGYTTDLGINPVNRYLGISHDEAVGPDYELGLIILKTLAETPPEPPAEE